MNFLSKYVLAVVLASYSAYASVDVDADAGAGADAEFWERYLGYYDKKAPPKMSMSITPAPTPPPTPPPTGVCLVEVNIGCSTSDGVECKDIEPCLPGGDCECEKEICYNYELCNIGSTEMDVTELLGGGNDLLPLLPANPLPVGDCTSIEECTTIDICTSGEHCTDLTAKANPPNGISCQDAAEYCFEIVVGTNPPTPSPTAAPTAPPPPDTSPPTASPTESCNLNIGIQCTLSTGEECNVATPNVVPCEGRPLMMGMLFNGGTCQQSFNTQDNGKFSCEDFGDGPPTAEGSESYVLVTAQNDPSVVYFEGAVTVGEIFRLEDKTSPGTRFVADQTIKVFEDETMADGTMLQLVDYHSSCSQNLDLKNRFGASQIVEWYNEEQGLITCFSNISYDLIINIPLEISGDSLDLDKLVIRTNFDGTKNLTDQVVGLSVPKGGSVNVQFDVNIDLAVKARYTFLTTIAGTTETGVRCQGVNFDSFLIGFPEEETGLFPTVAPGP